MQLRRLGIALFAICVVLGALLTVQLKTQQNLRSSLPTHQASDLALMLREQERTVQALEDEIRQVRQERRDADTKSQLARLKRLVGLTEVEGPGLVVTLSTSGADAYIDPLWVDTVINELWSAGAEAIAINGQRIITTTGIGGVDAGYGIVVNGRKLRPPFSIEAIGDPMTLDSALRMRNSAVDLLKYYDLEVSLNQVHKVTIPAYEGSLDYTYISTPSMQDRR